MAKDARTVTTGTSVPMSTFEIVGQQAFAQSDASGVGAGSAGTCVGKAPKVRAFTVYYDMKARKLMVHDPLVIVDGESVGVEDASVGVEGGQLSCSVWVEAGVAKARLEGEGGADHDGLLAKVPIAYVADPDSPDGVTQQHVGAIVIGAVAKFEGDAFGSETVSATSDVVNITGSDDVEGGSGIEFLTEKPEVGSPRIVARIVGKKQGEDWRACSLTVKKGDGSDDETVGFLGSGDVTVDPGGSVETATQDVITGITGVEVDNGSLKIKYKHRSVTIVKSDTTESEATTDELCSLQMIDYVERSDYSAATGHEFVNTYGKAVVLGIEKAKDPETVFTTTEHSKE